MGANREGVNVSEYWDNLVQRNSDGTFSTLEGTDRDIGGANAVLLTTDQTVEGDKTFTDAVVFAAGSDSGDHPMVTANLSGNGACMRFWNQHPTTNIAGEWVAYQGNGNNYNDTGQRKGIIRSNYHSDTDAPGWGFQFYGQRHNQDGVQPIGRILPRLVDNVGKGVLKDFVWEGEDIDFSYLKQEGATTGQVIKWNGASWEPQDDTDTTYTAGTGVSLSGTTFSADFGELGIPSTTIDGNGGTQRKVLKITGSAGSPVYSWVDDLNFTGLTGETTIATDDEMPFYDKSATDNKKITFANFKTALAINEFDINGLTAETTIADGDALGFYDTSATSDKKITFSNLKSALNISEFDINALASSITSLADSDIFAVYDAGTTKDVKVSWANVKKGLSSNNFTAETTLADTDEFDFYDTSATSQKKITVANLKTALASSFDSTADYSVTGDWTFGDETYPGDDDDFAASARSSTREEVDFEGARLVGNVFKRDNSDDGNRTFLVQDFSGVPAPVTNSTVNRTDVFSGYRDNATTPERQNALSQELLYEGYFYDDDGDTKSKFWNSWIVGGRELNRDGTDTSDLLTPWLSANPHHVKVDVALDVNADADFSEDVTLGSSSSDTITVNGTTTFETSVTFENSVAVFERNPQIKPFSLWGSGTSRALEIYLDDTPADDEFGSGIEFTTNTTSSGNAKVNNVDWGIYPFFDDAYSDGEFETDGTTQVVVRNRARHGSGSDSSSDRNFRIGGVRATRNGTRNYHDYFHGAFAEDGQIGLVDYGLNGTSVYAQISDGLIDFQSNDVEFVASSSHNNNTDYDKAVTFGAYAKDTLTTFAFAGGVEVHTKTGSASNSIDSKVVIGVAQSATDESTSPLEQANFEAENNWILTYSDVVTGGAIGSAGTTSGTTDTTTRTYITYAHGSGTVYRVFKKGSSDTINDEEIWDATDNDSHNVLATKTYTS